MRFRFALLFAASLLAAPLPGHAGKRHTTSASDSLDQTSSQEQAAQTYIDAANAQLAQSAMAAAMGLTQMKGTCAAGGSDFKVIEPGAAPNAQSEGGNTPPASTATATATSSSTGTASGGPPKNPDPPSDFDPTYDGGSGGSDGSGNRG